MNCYCILWWIIANKNKEYSTNIGNVGLSFTLFTCYSHPSQIPSLAKPDQLIKIPAAYNICEYSECWIIRKKDNQSPAPWRMHPTFRRYPGTDSGEQQTVLVDILGHHRGNGLGLRFPFYLPATQCK